jgi:hypothetical protein
MVCDDHALEFWTGLLVYARHSSDPSMKHKGVCSCASCERLNEAYLRALAVAGSRLSPTDRARNPIRRAS